MAYTTLVDVKGYLGIANDDEDPLIEQMIVEAKQIIDDHFLRTFEADTATTRYFDAERNVIGNKLFFDQDLVSITGVVNGDGVPVEVGQYFLPNITPYPWIQLTNASGLSWNYDEDATNAIAVTGMWAYSLTPPVSVRALARWLVATMYRGKDNVWSAGETFSFANTTNILAGNVPPDVRLLMRNIPRRSVVGAF